MGAAFAALLAVGCGGDASGAGDGGDDGDLHALGDEVVVGYSEPTDTGQAGISTTLGVTVQAVRQGSQEDLTEAGFEVDTEDQSTTPYYVDVRYENQGENGVKKNLDVSLEDAQGNLISSTVIFNFGDRELPPCPHVNEGQLQPGDSYEACTLFLVPEGSEVAKVSFLAYPNGADAEPEFVYWEAA